MKRFGLSVEGELRAWQDELPRFLHGTPVLVIVDMQPVFKAANDQSTIDQVCLEIKNARRKGWWIAVLEYACPGESKDLRETNSQIMKALAGYKRVLLVSKVAEDGSVELLDALNRRGIRMRRMIICGVNTGRCVAETMFGVMEKRMSLPVTAALNACNDDLDFNWSCWIGASDNLGIRYRAGDDRWE